MSATGAFAGVINLCPEPVARTDAPEQVPDLRPATPARRRRRIVVESLYPVPRSEAEVHAKALLELVATECPHLAGRYVPQHDLVRTYEELCRSENWTARHWTSIGRELAKITDRRKAKRNGKRFPAYRIPRAA